MPHPVNINKFTASFVTQNFNYREEIRWLSNLVEANEHLLNVCSCFDNKDVQEIFFCDFELSYKHQDNRKQRDKITREGLPHIHPQSRQKDRPLALPPIPTPIKERTNKLADKLDARVTFHIF